MRAKSKSGLTLVEAVLAVMVLCVATAGSALVVVASAKVADQARDHYVAVNLAHNRIERAKTMTGTGYSNLTSLNETGTVVNVDGDETANGTYMRVTAVTVLSSGATQLTQIVVSVAVKNRVTLAFNTNGADVESMTCEFTQLIN